MELCDLIQAFGEGPIEGFDLQSLGLPFQGRRFGVCFVRADVHELAMLLATDASCCVGSALRRKSRESHSLPTGNRISSPLGRMESGSGAVGECFIETLEQCVGQQAGHLVVSFFELTLLCLAAFGCGVNRHDSNRSGRIV